ncbi:thiolase family protein [Neotabrizicola sp. VNH66]|uniref:thiolase family protein n=1 Tax=Neotabrizicola sp. VNH66 TaxID=3400918 RepID=UPI003C09ACC7
MTARIIAARRSAVVPRGGAFAGLRVEDMAAPVIAALLADAGMAPGAVEEVICAESIGQGGNPARRIALAAGLPEGVAGLSIDRQCAGGLDAIALAAALVTAGRAQVVVAGGVESASRSPFAQGAGRGFLQAPFTPWPGRDPDMAAAADRLGIPRAEQDAWAVDSHAKALLAASWPEIVPLAGQGRDAFARALTPALAARAPVLHGQITAANAAVAADAAAFVLVVSPKVAQGRGLRIAGAATVGARPEEPGLAAIPAMQAALVEAGVQPGVLERAEVMEAYAAQAIACVRGTGLDPARVNLKGGALARGHPIGASGAILAVRLFHDLTDGPGLAGIAAAGGIGAALVLAPG